VTVYINVGALTLDGVRIRTKKALIEEIVDRNVFFDQTAYVHDGNLPETFTVNDFYAATEHKTIILSVVGPDPYTKRNWYANVEINKNGGIKVS